MNLASHTDAADLIAGLITAGLSEETDLDLFRATVTHDGPDIALTIPRRGDFGTSYTIRLSITGLTIKDRFASIARPHGPPAVGGDLMDGGGA